MNTETIPDSLLEELLENDIPCRDCGRAAQLRSRGHGCSEPISYRCIPCWQRWFAVIMGKILKYGSVFCLNCAAFFDVLEDFSDYREF